MAVIPKWNALLPNCMNQSFEFELENHLKKFTSSPYLFIGSGFSNRYINTDNWKTLLKNVCDDLHLPNTFYYYFTKANSDLCKVATLMSEDLFEIWWKEDRFSLSREKFANKAKDKESPLKFEICEFLMKNNYSISKEMDIEYKLLKTINVEGIITTNWDLLLEKTFGEFESYIGQNRLIFNNAINIGEIYKIHGCVSDPNSLVVTESDYSAFHERNPYLAAKLLTIFMEHPILFLGYSIGDPNIHLILNSIIKILDGNNISKLKDRLIFCERDNSINECTINDGNILISGMNLPIKQIRYKNLNNVYSVLSKNNKRLPIKILRHMKNMVYDFVKNSNSKSKVYLADENNIDKLDLKQVQFVYGFGIKESLSSIGVKGIGAKDLLLDILEPKLKFEPLNIVRDALPNIQGVYKPYFKYLRLANLLDENGLIQVKKDTLGLDLKFISEINNITQKNFYPMGSYAVKEKEVNEKYKTINELISQESVKHAIIYIPLLKMEKINTKDLLFFINNIEINFEKIPTDIRKLICLYDYFKYKLQK